MTVIKEFVQSVKLYDDNNYEQTLSTIKTLLECGCCCRCCLRFLGCNNLKLYSFEEQVKKRRGEESKSNQWNQV